MLAGYLRRVRAAAAEPEHIVICTGFAQGLNLVLRVLAQRWVRRVALDDPCCQGGRPPAAGRMR